ncbi:plasmid pRiA4b ORF-3 family protein [Vibrio metschnikovii]|uniref:plasmid pRiA4b ORF-3 family protein n=1 Tax=Vibrio metschnikovii TaxID=28172 RepID=UPI001C30033B|nr:plasmid pRiA4b ORF-3 family protein [Vibrio metschnikovii]
MTDIFPEPMDKIWPLIINNTPFHKLNSKQLALLSQPAALLMAIPIGLTMPEQVAKQCAETFIHYFDYMTNELRITLRNDSQSSLLPILNHSLQQMIEEGGINVEMAYRIVKVLKAHQLMIDDVIIELLAQNHWQDSSKTPLDIEPNPEQMMAQMLTLVQQQGIKSGFDFCQFISDELAVLPIEGVRALLGCFIKQTWIVDALLLLTLHKEPTVSLVAAQLLDNVEEKRWKKLTQRNYLTIIQRFGDEQVKAHLPQWNRLAMKHAKPVQVSQVVELYMSFADGNHSTLFLALLKEPGAKASHLVGGVFRLGYGLVDSYFTPQVDKYYYQQVVHTLREEVAAIPCNPLLFSHLLPWALATQKNSPERMSVEMVHMLAMLPSQWSEPQAFDLAKISEVCHVEPHHFDTKRDGRLTSKMLINTPMFDSWLVDEIEPQLTKVQQVRDHYYLAHPQRYIEALAHAALMSHFSLLGPSLWLSRPQTYLSCAYALQQGPVGRKTFPMFDWLAEQSLLHHQQQRQLDNFAKIAGKSKGYVIKVELQGSRPKVWRRFTVSSGIDCHAFHHLLQTMMGWTNRHLYSFITPLGRIDDSDESQFPADELPLMAVLQAEGDQIEYIYDFGDYWSHSVILEKINQRDCLQPKVTAGNGACPPEDCGGIHRYIALLTLINQDRLTQHQQEQLEWSGLDDDWDARLFDKQAVNAQLV